MTSKPGSNWWDSRSHAYGAVGRIPQRHAADSFNRTFVRRSTPKPWKTV